MKHLLCIGMLLLVAFSGRAQAVRFSTQGHLPIESQPAPGYEQADYLGMGDSVRVLSNPAAAVPSSISAAMRRQFVYISYPAYRGQAAGRGWVLRRGLVATADSLLLDLPPLPAQTVTTTKVVTTRRYVPASQVVPAKKAGAKAGRPAPAAGKATPKTPRP
ncbi:hypothetical protein [Hymenobacter bucti]|uniref:Uncharacterized protein n=1 Tax=Hymenobacter bucti TaxID=1844114 RepID=A0ABW4QMQ3_9BACT